MERNRQFLEWHWLLFLLRMWNQNFFCFRTGKFSSAAPTNATLDKGLELNEVFANHSEDNEIYPLTVTEIVDAQKADTKLKDFFKLNATLDKGLEIRIIEDQKCICNKERLVIPKLLQRRATMWYHHYLQHLEHDRLERTMNAAIYWKCI